jgi:hypothetical protein
MKLHPYFKKPRVSHAHASGAGRAGPWAVPDLCEAYAWPRGLAGGGVIAVVELHALEPYVRKEDVCP